MSFSMTSTGWQGVILELTRTEAQIKNALSIAAFAMGEVAYDWVVENMQAKKSGYHHANLPRQSSAPGEVPATQFGDLMESLEVIETEKKATVGEAAFIAGDGSTPYAVELEFGSGDVAARPYMRPAMDNNIPEFLKAAERAFAEEIF